MDGAVNSVRSNPLYWAKKVRHGYERLAQLRGYFGENDFNGGKLGLAYYLMFKAMNNPQLTDTDLSNLVRHWTAAAYGAGIETANVTNAMMEYYNLVLAGSQVISAPNLWSQATSKLDAAYALASDEASRQRLDDLKQHWYHYSLIDDGFAANVSAKDLAWKGQMGYQISSRVDVILGWGNTDLYGDTGYTYGAATSPPTTTWPFHFSTAETAAWWAGVKTHWQTMVGGTKGARMRIISSFVSALALAACGSSTPSAPADPGCALLAKCSDAVLEVQLCPARISVTRCKQIYEEYLRCYAEQHCSGDSAPEPATPSDAGNACTMAAQAWQYCRGGVDAGG